MPSSGPEASYVGLYTFVVSVIYLSEGGRCSESKLERALGKVNAADYVLGGQKTDKVLKQMEKDGYIVKVKEREAGGEESVEYVVGPRGRVEVSEVGVAGLVRDVYKGKDIDGLENRLEKSLGVGRVGNARDREADEPRGNGAAREVVAVEEEVQGDRRSSRRSSRRGSRRGAREEEDDDDEEEED